MYSKRGSLWGNGKQGADGAGCINDGQVLTMQVDLDAGTLKFWVDGKPHGPGFTSGVTGRLRWATSMFSKACIQVHLHGQHLAIMDFTSIIITAFAIAIK